MLVASNDEKKVWEFRFMKIAVECKSPLLQKSLEIFLSSHLSSIKLCDIVIRDIKCLEDDRCFYISQDKESDIVKPFSKSQLILALEKKYKSMGKSLSVKKEDTSESVLDFSILERRIELLTHEYKENILKAVKAFYEE